MTNAYKQNDREARKNLAGKMINVANELVRAWNFKMPARETPAMTTREHWDDLKRIAQREGILEAIKYDISLSFRSRQKERRYEFSSDFIPSHPLNVKRVYDSWSKLRKITPEELYDCTVGAVRKGSEQYEDAARRVAQWYGFSTERVDDAILECTKKEGK